MQKNTRKGTINKNIYSTHFHVLPYLHHKQVLNKCANPYHFLKVKVEISILFNVEFIASIIK